MVMIRGGSRKKERGGGGVCVLFGVTPTSSEVRLRKIPFSARRSPILDCRNCCEQLSQLNLASLASDLPQLVKLLSQLLKT